jgi:hypothetical protein
MTASILLEPWRALERDPHQRVDQVTVVVDLGAEGEERLGRKQIWVDWVLATRG